MLARTLAIAGLIAFIAPGALADDEDSFVREAGYLAISGVGAFEQIGKSLEREVNPSDGGGLSVRAGYRMFRYASTTPWAPKIGSNRTRSVESGSACPT